MKQLEEYERAMRLRAMIEENRRRYLRTKRRAAWSFLLVGAALFGAGLGFDQPAIALAGAIFWIAATVIGLSA